VLLGGTMEEGKVALDVVTINQEIYLSGKRLVDGSNKLFSLAQEMAQSEQNYRKSLALEIIRLREEKVQATLIPDIARGNTSELKYKRDLAEARWQSAKQSLDAIKSQQNGLQTIAKYLENI
jgi:hypothetical protein